MSSEDALIADVEDMPVVAARIATRPAWRVADVVRLIRPQQWTKNVFVFAPLVFGNLWLVPAAQIATLTALVCFCLWSSAVYCLNDALDADADRAHPRKKNRPVAAGRISAGAAITLAAALFAGSSALAYTMLPRAFMIVGALYLGVNLAYCLSLKHRVLVDVLAIAVGFVLRLEGGCVAIGVEASSWILVCGFSLALVLGFGKRRLEVSNTDRPADFRPVLQLYSAEKLNLLLGITVSVCLLSYMLYTVSPETAALHHTSKLVYTVPFVAYGLFRFIFIVQEGRHDGPVEVLLHDPSFAINGVLWIAATIGILYLT